MKFAIIIADDAVNAINADIFILKLKAYNMIKNVSVKTMQ